MKCPRTGAPLKEVEVGGVKVDISEGCGGVWLDRFELQKFDEAHEFHGEELVGLLEKYRNENIDFSARINSPKHPDYVMMRRFYSPARKIEIDECPKSGGIWLDPGELAQLRELFETEQERKVAVDKLVTDMLADSGINEMVRESEEKARKAEQIARVLRWLTLGFVKER